MARWRKDVASEEHRITHENSAAPDGAPTREDAMSEKISDNEAVTGAAAEEQKGLCQSEHPDVPPAHHGSLNALVIEAQVIDAIETVYDPEIPVNIHELGLIYDVKVSDDGVVDVTMTLTAPGCPAAQTLPVEVEQKVSAIPGVTKARVEVTFDPPWSMDLMSDAARLQLGFM